MKVISITIIKNEADIIESFIRYHLNIVDMMIILDNGSNDNTLTILNQLKKESLPIIVLENDNNFLEYCKEYNKLLDVALNKYGADIVCPLDCDEFISCENNNPRDILEKMPPNSYYKIKLMTFVPLPDDGELKFIPSRITHIRDENLEKYSKVIITKELVKKFNIQLDSGNYNIKFNDKNKNKINCIENTQMKIAHYPLRSVPQTISKIIVNSINNPKTIDDKTKSNYTTIYNKIKNKIYSDSPHDLNNINILNKEDICTFAKQYCLDLNHNSNYKDCNQIKLKKQPINLDFCKNLEIKYSYTDNYLNNLIITYVSLYEEYGYEIYTLKNEINKKNKEIDEVTHLKNNLERQCNTLIEDNINLKQEKYNLNNMINKINNNHSELVKRNSILTKSKIKQQKLIEELKEDNENQQSLINKLKNKTFKDYLKEFLGF